MPWTSVTDITEVSLQFNFDTTLHLIPASLLLKQKVISCVTEIVIFLSMQEHWDSQSHSDSFNKSFIFGQ